MAATQPGALKWARRYGASLVCVRYRHDAQGQHRYTTVELVVDDAPVAGRAQLDKMVILDLAFDESEMLKRVVVHGAEWDGEQRLWRMSRRMVEQLGLLSRVVES
jgi:hypothetical protein